MNEISGIFFENQKASFVQAYVAKALSTVREGRFDIRFCRQGMRARIRDRYVSYPFHFTRPFMLDASIPQLLTLYQQSSSGGLYQGTGLDYLLFWKMKRPLMSPVKPQPLCIMVMNCSVIKQQPFRRVRGAFLSWCLIAPSCFQAHGLKIKPRFA